MTPFDDWFTFGCVEALSGNHFSNALPNSDLMSDFRFHDNDRGASPSAVLESNEITNAVESCFRPH